MQKTCEKCKRKIKIPAHKKREYLNNIKNKKSETVHVQCPHCLSNIEMRFW